jgi:Bifunctional DNA primase/polymerase, N-terminal
MLRDTLTIAFLYLRAGLSIIPIRPDGSKSPAISEWRSYQHRRATESQVYRWFNNDAGYGVAILGGAGSGWLEIFDCDAPELFDSWCEIVEAHYPGLLSRCVIVQTPSGGWHVYYRCKRIEGNLKLARRAIEVPEGTENAKPESGRWIIVKTLLETRGAGGYALAPGSPANCHELNLPYLLMSGDFATIPTVTPEQRKVMLDAARWLNEYIPPERIYTPRTSHAPSLGNRPGDEYNARADWFELLTRHGWKFVFTHRRVTYWKRPGKDARGWSATTNYGDSNLLYVFSTNCWPFEDWKAYSLFSAYAILEHGGDFTAATRSLASQGYGEQRKPKIIIPPKIQPVARPKETILLSPVSRPLNTIRLATPSRPPATILLNLEAGR